MSADQAKALFSSAVLVAALAGALFMYNSLTEKLDAESRGVVLVVATTPIDSVHLWVRFTDDVGDRNEGDSLGFAVAYALRDHHPVEATLEIALVDAFAEQADIACESADTSAAKETTYDELNTFVRQTVLAHYAEDSLGAASDQPEERTTGSDVARLASALPYRVVTARLPLLELRDDASEDDRQFAEPYSYSRRGWIYCSVRRDAVWSATRFLERFSSPQFAFGAPRTPTNRLNADATIALTPSSDRRHDWSTLEPEVDRERQHRWTDKGAMKVHHISSDLDRIEFTNLRAIDVQFQKTDFFGTRDLFVLLLGVTVSLAAAAFLALGIYVIDIWRR